MQLQEILQVGRIWQVGKLGKAERAPAPAQASLTLVFFQGFTGSSLHKQAAVFLAGERRYAGAGARSALPTFPTCKFAELELVNQVEWLRILRGGALRFAPLSYLQVKGLERHILFTQSTKSLQISFCGNIPKACPMVSTYHLAKDLQGLIAAPVVEVPIANAVEDAI